MLTGLIFGRHSILKWVYVWVYVCMYVWVYVCMYVLCEFEHVTNAIVYVTSIDYSRSKME